jgi:hypothetical protein
MFIQKGTEYMREDYNNYTSWTSSMTLGLGFVPRAFEKKGPPSPKAGAEQGNIETVHEPKPIQTEGARWGQGRRAMADSLSPYSQDVKGRTPSR